MSILTTQPNGRQRILLTVLEVMILLRYQQRRSVYDLITSGTLPAHRRERGKAPGRPRWLIDLDDLNAYLDRIKVEGHTPEAPTSQPTATQGQPHDPD